MWRPKFIVATCVPFVCVAGATVLLTVPGAVGADPTPDAKAEPWGAKVNDLCTRLVPLEKQYVLGRPMNIRLEMKNVGQKKVEYDTQQVANNNPLEVHDPQGKRVGYIGYRGQTMSGRLPSLAPGSSVILFNDFDLASNYFIAKPGKYMVRRKHEWGGIPASGALVIDVQPGPLPPAWQVAARLSDAMPRNWEITAVQAAPGENSPPGWESGRKVSFISAACPDFPRTLQENGRGIQVDIWISDRKLEWTGKVPGEGDRAAFYLGKCPEGCVYAALPSYAEARTAKWDTIEQDIKKALHTVSYENRYSTGMQNDDYLKNLKGLKELEHLHLDSAKITDAGLKHLKDSTKLKSLSLSRTRITDTGLQYIAGMTQLETLFLEDTKITDAGLKHLQGLTKLGGLWLRNTEITGSGLDYLEGLARLNAIMLDNAKITDAGLQHIKRLTQLGGLSLAGVTITDAGLKNLRGLTHLENLDLSDTKITDVGLENLKGLTQLRELTLNHTEITDAGLEHLKGLTKLTSLRLEKTHVTDQGVKKLQQIVPGCEFYYGEDNRDRQRF